jgi:hypothetical protein
VFFFGGCGRDANEDSDPEVKDVPEVKDASDVSSGIRHLLDMDMDDMKPNAFAHPVDWELVNDAVKGKLDAAKGKLDAAKTESVVDIGEVRSATELYFSDGLVHIYK